MTTRGLLRPGQPLATIMRSANLGLRPPYGSDGVLVSSDRLGTFTPVASATPHTKGSYVELIASTTYDVGVLTIGCLGPASGVTGTAATDSSTLMDVAIGPAASEVVIIPNVPVGYRSNIWEHEFPIFIPRGTRIAARIQSVQVSKSITAMGWLTQPYDTANPLPPQSLVTMGANTGTSKGVTVSTPGSVDTKGSWSEITAAAGQPFSGLIVAPQGNSSTGMVASCILIDIGAGAAGSERVIIPDITIGGNAAGEYYIQMATMSFRYWVPKDVRLAARYARDSAGNELDLALIGIPQRW